MLVKIFHKLKQQQLLFMLIISNENLRNDRRLSRWKRDYTIGVFCEFCEIFKNTFITEHFRVTASGIWMQVVAIYNLNLSLEFLTINFTLFCEFSFWPMLQCRLNFFTHLFFDRVIFRHDSKTASKEK